MSNNSIEKFICRYVKCIKMPEDRDDYILNKIYKVKCNGDIPYVPHEKYRADEPEYGIMLSYAVDCFEPIFLNNSDIMNTEKVTTNSNISEFKLGDRVLVDNSIKGKIVDIDDITNFYSTYYGIKCDLEQSNIHTNTPISNNYMVPLYKHITTTCDRMKLI